MISIKEVPHNPPPHTISGVKFKKNSDFFMIQDLDDLCIFIFNDKQQLPYSIVEGSFSFLVHMSPPSVISFTVMVVAITCSSMPSSMSVVYPTIVIGSLQIMNFFW